MPRKRVHAKRQTGYPEPKIYWTCESLLHQVRWESNIISTTAGSFNFPCPLSWSLFSLKTPKQSILSLLWQTPETLAGPHQDLLWQPASTLTRWGIQHIGNSFWICPMGGKRWVVTTLMQIMQRLQCCKSQVHSVPSRWANISIWFITVTFLSPRFLDDHWTMKPYVGVIWG